MNSRHLIDPDLVQALDSFPKLDFADEGLMQARAIVRTTTESTAAMMPPCSNIEQKEYVIPVPKGATNVRLLVYSPKNRTSNVPVYYHIHGGGYVMASADMSALHNAARAEHLGCVVVSVDYRLAPETVFPGAVEDCYAGLKWLYANASILGVDKNRIAVGGESAGGGLAAALALLARDEEEVPLIHQHLIYPMLDDRTVSDRHPYTGDFVWTRSHNNFGWKSLLGREPGDAKTSPYAAAARAENLAGLPPAFVSTGALDLFLEENMEYARRLSRAGVPVELHVYPGAFHGFDLMAPDSRLGKAHARDNLDALRHAFNRGRPRPSMV